MSFRHWLYFWICVITIFGLLVVRSNRSNVLNKPDYSGLAGYVLTAVRATSYALATHLRDFESIDLNLSRSEMLKLHKHIVLRYQSEFSGWRGVRVLPNGEILDVWGHPLRIRVLNTGRDDTVLTLRVWSIGKNGIDEHGFGDDVSAEEITIPRR